MSDLIDQSRARLLRAAFRMPSPPTMVSRKSTITNAFVCAIIPVVEPTVEEIQEALRILVMEPDDVRCAYCGDRATEWDHLRPLVKARRPTGYISEIGNLVPACAKCNQSKGNSAWEQWMRSTRANWSPASRGIADLEARIQRLHDYERWRPICPCNLNAIVGNVAWNSYWAKLDEVNRMLADCQATALGLRAQIAAAHDGITREAAAAQGTLG